MVISRTERDWPTILMMRELHIRTMILYFERYLIFGLERLDQEQDLLLATILVYTLIISLQLNKMRFIRIPSTEKPLSPWITAGPHPCPLWVGSFKATIVRARGR